MASTYFDNCEHIVFGCSYYCVFTAPGPFHRTYVHPDSGKESVSLLYTTMERVGNVGKLGRYSLNVSLRSAANVVVTPPADLRLVIQSGKDPFRFYLSGELATELIVRYNEVCSTVQFLVVHETKPTRGGSKEIEFLLKINGVLYPLFCYHTHSDQTSFGRPQASEAIIQPDTQFWNYELIRGIISDKFSAMNLKLDEIRLLGFLARAFGTVDIPPGATLTQERFDEFFEWFCYAEEIIRSNTVLWQQYLLAGYIPSNVVGKFLENKPPGSFLLRLGSPSGYLVISQAKDSNSPLKHTVIYMNQFPVAQIIQHTQGLDYIENFITRESVPIRSIIRFTGLPSERSHSLDNRGRYSIAIPLVQQTPAPQGQAILHWKQFM